MTKTATCKHVRCISFLLVLILLLSAMPPMAMATDTADSNDATFTITGSYRERFELSSDKSKLFHLADIAPGDVWTGQIKVKNAASEDMYFCVFSILSNIEDTTLFDALTLQISMNEKTLYSGSYNPNKERLTEYIRIAPHKTLTLDVVVTLPKHLGNNVMNKELDATWTFEATYTDDPIVSPPTGDTSNPMLVGTICLISLLGLILIFLFMRKKEEDEDKQAREVT